MQGINPLAGSWPNVEGLHLGGTACWIHYICYNWLIRAHVFCRGESDEGLSYYRDS
jgi:hypothetical protein